MSMICPYCSSDLINFKFRKSKCKVCGNQVYYKYTPDNRTKRVMTEAQANEAESLWHQYAERQYLDRLADIISIPHGLTKIQIEVMARLICDNEELSPQLRLMSANLMVSYFCKDQNERIFYTDLLFRMDLYRIPPEFRGSVEIGCHRDSCASCRELQGKRFRFEDALQTPLMPNYLCSNWQQGRPICCSWRPVLNSLDSVN